MVSELHRLLHTPSNIKQRLFNTTTCKRSPLRATERHWAPLDPSGYKRPSSTPRGLEPTKEGSVVTHSTGDARSTSSRACSNLRRLAVETDRKSEGLPVHTAER